MLRRQPMSTLTDTLFPSTTLFRSVSFSLGRSKPVNWRPGTPLNQRCRSGKLRRRDPPGFRSEEHTSELQSLMRNSYAVFCLKKQNKHTEAEERRTTNQNEIQQDNSKD